MKSKRIGHGFVLLAVLFISTLCLTGVAAGAYFSDNFENGLGNWVVSGSDWALTTADARSATHSITDSPSGNYPPSANSTITLANPIDLSGATSPVLSFWHKYWLESYYFGPDYGYVEVSQDSGLTWTQVTSFTGSVASWTNVLLDLTPYKSKPVLLRFRLVDNPGYGQADGWYIDDVEIKEKDTATIAFPFYDNFENGLSNWLVSGRDWSLITDDYRSATHSITDSPSGNYPPSANSTITLAHPIDLSGATSPVLSFWHKYWLDSYGFGPDWGYVEVSQDGGLTWTQVTSFTGSVASWT
ncbi:MAG TPA: hypothetical protein VJ508_05250, partial [Saprospiraceae bacterium]|nr:hypothetical protein [Saprospiraceae bacterium]